MKYAGMPSALWMVFANSFEKQLTIVFGYDKAAGCKNADEILRGCDDDKTNEMVLPCQRKEKIYRKESRRTAQHRRFPCRRPQPVFLEYGTVRV